VTKIKARAKIDADGRITLEACAPPDVLPGEHEVTVIIEDDPAAKKTTKPLKFPVDNYGPWPKGLSLRREDLYDDDGR
jgi:hypothetical protein